MKGACSPSPSATVPCPDCDTFETVVTSPDSRQGPQPPQGGAGWGGHLALNLLLRGLSFSFKKTGSVTGVQMLSETTSAPPIRHCAWKLAKVPGVSSPSGSLCSCCPGRQPQVYPEAPWHRTPRVHSPPTACTQRPLPCWGSALGEPPESESPPQAALPPPRPHAHILLGSLRLLIIKITHVQFRDLLMQKNWPDTASC